MDPAGSNASTMRPLALAEICDRLAPLKVVRRQTPNPRGAVERDALKDFDPARYRHGDLLPGALHLQKCFDYLQHRAGDFPESERAALETLALPVYPELTQAQLEHVIASIAEFYR